jgi:phosphatidylglycerol:prolipoprotein diacylglycerol transferase
LLPEIDIGPLILQAFGLCLALGFIGAGALAWRRLEELGKPGDWAYEGLFAALIGGLVGSRLYYVVENYDAVKDDLLGNLFTGSGLVWYGGLIGGAIAVCTWAWFRGFLNLTLLDVAAPSLAIGQAIGRIGCQLSGDGDYGTTWDGPWAMPYPDGIEPIDEPVHPTPVYETLTLGLIALVLWRLWFALTNGLLFALYLLLAGTGRFLVEFVRRNDEVALGLTQAQLIALGMMLAGGLWLLLATRRTPRPATA